MSEAQRMRQNGSFNHGNGYLNGAISLRSPATRSAIDEFCNALGGKKPIHSILIANNGMAAVKFIRSVRTWSYETFGSEKAILLVAMATPEDMRINAEHIRIADQFVEVPGGTNNNNYANVQLIVETAEITHVDAVWPGWGHASEIPELPDALEAKGIIFLGPPALSMAALGDKIGSSLIAQAADVPTLPWSGSHVKIPPNSCLVTIPDDIYRKACVHTTEEAIASCQVVGYPAMIKASWGGGGKGIRKVHNDEEVKALFKQVQGEVPGSPIFIMKVASQSRHLEVQLLCDQHGNVAALHSRDCSVQRRHQKIIEEGPITIAPPETIKKLEQAARRLAKSVNYVGAATVEYLYSMETEDYYFLELNPRLQVEHPVTEWIAEINLPAAQVAVNAGFYLRFSFKAIFYLHFSFLSALIFMPSWLEIRRFYGMENSGGYDAWRRTSELATPFDFDKAESTRPKGHCVAVRVTSEDPDDGFKPTSGKVQELSFKSKPNVWAYFSVKSGGGIHEFSDSQFGHVFAFGESRTLAIANMVLGLKEIQIRGEIRTNVDYTIDLLHAPDYRENRIHTGWLDSRIAMRVRAERPPWYLSVVGGALYKAAARSAAMVSDYVGYLEKGQIPPKHISLVNSQVSLNIEGSRYTIDMVKRGPGSYRLRMNQSEVEAEIHTLRDGGLLMQNDHDPSKLVAETPCKLLRYLVSDGSHVDADTPYAEVEVMKMCMPLLSPASGVIHFKLSEGQAMQAGELIARLDLDDPSAVRKAEPFHGSFPVLGPPTAISDKVHQKCAATLSAARMILAGYDHDIDDVVQNLLRCLDSPELPFLQWQECFALESKFKEYEGISNQQTIDFPAKVLRSILETHLGSCSGKEKGAQERLIEPLMSLVKSYEGVKSTQGVRSKNKLILRLMEHLVYPNPAAYRDKLIRFSILNHLNYSELALKASQLLEQTRLSELRSSIARSLSELEMFTEEGENMDTPKRKSAINERMEDIVSAPLAVEDALVGLFDHIDHTLQRRVVETYVRRLYQPYLAKGSVRMQWHRSGLIASWQFMEGHIEEANTSDYEMTEQPLVDKKWGAMVIIKSLQFLPDVISAALKETTHNSHGTSQNGFADPSNHGYGVISCIIQRDEGRGPMRHSFHWSEENHYYVEEPLLRHLEPPLSIYLELDKLKEYEHIKYTPSRDRQWHMYTVEAKPLPIQRMFLRTLVRQPTKEWFSGYQGSDIAGPESQWTLSFTSRSILRSLVTAMEELELHVHNATVKSDHAHIIDVDGGKEEAAVETLLVKLACEIHTLVGVKMHRLGVFEWEVKLCMVSSGQANGAWRVVVTNVTGHTCIVHVYRELEDSGKHKVVYHATSTPGPLHGVPVNTPFQPLGLLDQKRLLARKSNTTYCYDFGLAFEAALEKVWSSRLPADSRPKGKLVNVTELVFADQRGSWGTPLVPVNREPAQNNVGMVAWTMELCTPEFPDGRVILVVANDVTFRNGSFGPLEDAFFEAVTDLACAKKLPLIYLAANSGARIGAAEEVRSCFKIGWSDESNTDSGFQYLYLTPEDYARIKSSVIAHEVCLSSGEARWIIDTIVGKEDGLGVENLSGSGAIAGAYSKAYKETFTLTYVTGRTVGIGAYLARLGMRCIQRLDQPIILTGFSALNKLLGREVYSSQMQLGGPKIMATNGVVHLTVSDDLEGISAILNWLSFVPPHVGGPLPVLAPVDPPERSVEYLPENSCDPRAAICGTPGGNGEWLGGIFDRNSFIETLEGWARTVVTGRAKLGGIPVGIVAVETQTMMQVIPADPGQLDSHERVVPQAGQVWFPDSASKTAQALMDFNREELPLFIMANWRGFSAGQRDLFEGILQAGSTIVENLRTYNQPVFVYIPKTGELRGGAWVVVDSRINSDHIEMYAETTAKGNVLEPEGMIEIKFRNKELLDCMSRLDPHLRNLKEKLQETKYDQTIVQQIKSREKQLLPIYTQIATKFAELHDTSFRMAAKGVVKEVVDWKISRFFFYKRLRRRLSEASLISSARDAAGDTLSYKSANDMIKKWFSDSKSEDLWLNDDAFFAWKDDPSNYNDKLAELCVQKVSNQLSKMGSSASALKALPQGLAALLQEMDPATKSKLIEELRRVIE
ncbi:Acetyl-CoA carboxylase, central domain-containing protein [Cynara cardunculus var. scolymus]|uniref:Acetyl-CoA carboxylase, central domain-containing protein n=1 Tax=Cynara cardunculus var. scolymus TaxID=59895 RepID=A0A103YDX3_CYNCS|nr:Acetyl-CoA carboxylase, central domain-containing protein [Cynara cardunculus var. scolymus]